MGYAWTGLGGHLALDLCNTVSWRLDPARRIERLAGPAELRDWFRFATGDAPEAGDAVLAGVRRLRDATARLVDTHVEGRDGDPADVRAVREMWLTAEVAPRLPLTEPAERAILPVLAVAVGELLHRADLSALRRCDGPGCGWLFLDTTRNHSRRWCDSQDCGNRARVRAYQRRRRTAEGA